MGTRIADRFRPRRLRRCEVRLGGVYAVYHRARYLATDHPDNQALAAVVAELGLALYGDEKVIPPIGR